MFEIEKVRHGSTRDGGQMMYVSTDSMALPAYLVTYDSNGQQTGRTSYDDRLYALALFAQETDNQQLLEQVWQEEADTDLSDCSNYEGDF